MTLDGEHAWELARELVVSSPGGLTEALHYTLKCLDGLEAQRVRTRVRSVVWSAVPVLAYDHDARIWTIDIAPGSGRV